jgi:phosphatidylglycerophosphate synthase
MKLFDSTLNRWIAGVFNWLLLRMPVWLSPNAITIIGAIASFVALGVGLTNHSLVLLCWLSLAALIFDIFDGQLARFRSQQSLFGKRLDAGVDITISICITMSVFVLEKDISLFFVLFLIFAYFLRFFAVVTNHEKEIGGLRPSLIIALLIAPLLGISLNMVLGIFLAWNTISVLWSFGNYVTSGSKNSVGM